MGDERGSYEKERESTEWRHESQRLKKKGRCEQGWDEGNFVTVKGDTIRLKDSEPGGGHYRARKKLERLSSRQGGGRGDSPLGGRECEKGKKKEMRGTWRVSGLKLPL